MRTRSHSHLWRLAMIAITATVVVTPAAAQRFAKQQGYCPDARPGRGLMGFDRLRKYADFNSNPAHTRAQYDAADARQNKLNDCGLWVRTSASVGIAGYQGHQWALKKGTAFNKKSTSLAELKKHLVGNRSPAVMEPLDDLEIEIGKTAYDMAYQNKSREEIERALYCDCLSRYPVAAKLSGVDYYQ